MIRNYFFSYILLPTFILVSLISCKDIFISSTEPPYNLNKHLKQGEIYKFPTDINKPITGTLIIKDSNENILIEGQMKEGKIHGTWMEYYNNGQLNRSGKFVDGKKTGLHKEWFENGEIKSEIYYVNGEIEGLWKKWDKNGIFISGITSKQKEGFF